MAAVNQEALKKMLEQYKYRDVTVGEITSVVSRYEDWKPVMGVYVFNDGSSRGLMSLTGTVPVSYRGSVCDILLCLWLLDTYPYTPPICFVKPTSVMMIKGGTHVDAIGKISLPYLHGWKHPQSDLCGLIQVMIEVFGEEPPVIFHPTIQAFRAAGPPNPSCRPAVSPSPNTGGYPGGPADPTLYPNQTPVSTTVGSNRKYTIRARRMKEEMDRTQAELDALKQGELHLNTLEDMATRIYQNVADINANIELLRKRYVDVIETVQKMDFQ